MEPCNQNLGLIKDIGKYLNNSRVIGISKLFGFEKLKPKADGVVYSSKVAVKESLKIYDSPKIDGILDCFRVKDGKLSQKKAEEKLDIWCQFCELLDIETTNYNDSDGEGEEFENDDDVFDDEE